MKICSKLLSLLVPLTVTALSQEAYPERQEVVTIAPSAIVKTVLNNTAGTIVLTTADKAVRIVDSKTLAERAQIPPQGTDRVTTIALTKSGQRLITGQTNGTIRTFILPAPTPGVSMSAHKTAVVAVAAQDENLSYSVGLDKSLLIADILSGTTLGSVSTAPLEPTGVSLHPDGRQFAVTLANGSVQFYNLAGLKPGILLKENTSRITVSCFSPDGEYFAAGTFDGNVYVWKVKDGSQAALLKPHSGSVSDILFSPGMSWLVSTSSDSSMAIVDVASLSPASSLRAEGMYWTQVMFGSDEVLLAATSTGNIERWLIRKTPPDVDPPVIVVESPEQRLGGIPQRLYTRQIVLQAVVWDNVKLSAVEVNGKRVEVTPLRSTDTVMVPPGAASGRFSITMKLDSVGRNRFTITAKDGLGLTSSKTVRVDRLSSAEALEVLSPDVKQELDVMFVPLQFRAWFDVKHVSISSNLVQIIRQKPVKGKLPGDVITEEIPLTAGYNQIQLDVEGTHGEKLSRTIGISRKYTPSVAAAPAKAVKRANTSGPQRWAVVVGVSDYSNPGIPSLKYADKDAEAFANFLRTPEGGGYDNEHMRVLLNEHATFGNLRDALMDFLSNAIDIDLVMIYFAGHGAPDPARPQNLYLLTHDTDPNKLGTTAFPMWQIQDVLARYITSKRIVVFSDACHSGGISVNFATRGVAVTEENLVNQYLADLSRSKEGTIVFTASAAGEVSQEFPEFGHGVFTYYLLDGLRGKADYNNDFTITINEAMQYTEENVKRKTRGSQNPTRSQTEYDKELTVSLISH